MEGLSVHHASEQINGMEQDGEVSNGVPMENGFESATSNHISGSGSSPEKKHSSSDKHRDKDRHSSSHKHKSSHSDKQRDKDHHRSSSSHKHSSSSSSHKHRSSDGKHHSSSSKDKSHHSSSSSKSSHRDKERDGHSSSSKDKDRHHSSSKDKSHSSSSKHKDGSSSKDRSHHSSSSKHSSSGDKHRSKEHSSQSSSHKEKHKNEKHIKEENQVEMNNVEIKTELEDSPVKMKEEPPSVISETVMLDDEPISETRKSSSPLKPKKYAAEEVDSEDDVPLSARMVKAEKRPIQSDSEDDTPLSARMNQAKKAKVKEEYPSPPTKKRKSVEDDEDFKPEKKKKKKKVEKAKVKTESASPVKGKKPKKEDTEEKWRWWEEERVDDGTKWKFLEHKGPVFAPPYEPLPSNVHFYYNGKPIQLSEEAEEVAGFYARMIEHDYTSKDMFNNNFFKDWRKVMTKEEREIITDLKLCDFREIHQYYQQQSEARKNRTKEEKQKIKAENEALVEEYGYCTMDNHKEKIGNFRIEPPGLFRGRGDHPRMGMLKKRITAHDIIINCSKDSDIPKPPEGQKWKEVRHDNTVTWLASWTENIQNSTKYIMLNPASKLKGEKDWQKYETARRLHKLIDRIRAQYREDWKSKEMRVRQRAVALYFIDKLALRAGNEKDEDQADTVGCCSLRVEHISLHEQMDNMEHVVVFDFLGKDSIRYYNKVSVEKRVFKNLQLFMDNKNEGDDLFDRLNTSIMNKHLQSLMDGLTAKVFRTYNASRTLQEQLDLLTNPDDPVPAKLLSYNRANRAVAVLCNHQRAVPKNFSKQMENLQNKIDAKKDAIKDAKRDLKAAKADAKAMKTEKAKTMVEKKRKAVQRLEEQLTKLEVQATDKDENKEIALGTSKLNYLDPRISVAWCKKWGVPIEKIYNKTQRQKFAWAIDMAEEDYVF